jgi:hypothetical protein
MDIDALCACVRCQPVAPRKRRRHLATQQQIVVSDDRDGSLLDWAEQPTNSPPIVFLLERLPHIRCLCLYVCGVRGLRLVAAEASADGGIVVLTCRCEPESNELGLTSPAAACSTQLKLDVGEPIDRSAPLTCAVADGYAYVRLSLAPEAARCDGRMEGTLMAGVIDEAAATAALDDGRASQQLREEAGLYHRAAAQRRRERAALADAVLRCRRCGDHAPPLLHVERARALPDVDISSLVDFMQCCEQIDFDWRCLFPELPPASPGSTSVSTTAPAPDMYDGGERPAPTSDASGDAARSAAAAPVQCFLGTHSLHMRTSPPTATWIDAAAAFVEPACHRHATPTEGVGIWAPLRCARCATTLGACRVGCEGSAPALATAVGAGGGPTPVPAWFDATAPPELQCTIQLLKSAMASVGAPPTDGSASSMVVEDVAELATGTGAMGEREAVVAADGSAQHAIADDGALAGYTTATLVADRILRAAEEEEGEHTRRFTIAGSALAPPELLILLLSPYVTLATNHPTPESSAAAASMLHERIADKPRGVVDALKVLYTADPAAIAASAGLGRGEGATGEHCLVLPEEGPRASVLAALRASTDMLPPTARQVGALHVGYLPVTATWD